MINKVTSLSAIALTALLISTGVLAHSGKFLTDGAGNKVLDGNGDCVFRWLPLVLGVVVATVVFRCCCCFCLSTGGLSVLCVCL